MKDDRTNGTPKGSADRLPEGVGSIVADAKNQVQQAADKVTDAAQNLYTQTQSAAEDVTNAAQGSVTSFEQLLRHTIETQPYTTALVALGVGWLLGRTHRPF
jgi:hypothetical protein